MVKTLASHAGIKGSIPLRVTILFFCADVAQQAEHFLGKEEVGSSNLLISSIKVPLKKEMKNMKDGKIPNPNTIYPIAGYDKEIYVKPTITNKNIIVGDFTYIADSDFESHVTHLYDFNNDKLIIGKFCQIASGVEFIMNGANHQMNAISTFPFYTLEGWEQTPPSVDDLPLKGDTIIGNDVWIGQNATILPGVHIGDGAIIGASSVVGHDVEPYTIVVGNPAKVIRKRFDDKLIQIMEELKWWDLSIEEINELIPTLTSSNLEKVTEDLAQRVKSKKTLR